MNVGFLEGDPERISQRKQYISKFWLETNNYTS